MDKTEIKKYQEQLVQEKKSITESLDYKELSDRGNYLANDPNGFSRMQFYRLDMKNIDRIINFSKILLGEKI